MRVLVTGASGFVGSAACSHLAGLGHQVVRWVGPGRTSDKTSFSVDIGDEATFPDAEKLGQLDAVVHCAGIAHRFGRVSGETLERVNVRGVENAVRFAQRAGAGRFILLSSVLVYGQPQTDEPVTENSPLSPDDDYGKSKVAGEEAAIRMCRSAGIALVILRPVPVVGEGSRGNVSRLIKAIDRRRFFWIGDGRNIRSFIYVGDVARAIGRSVEQGDEEPSVFNIAGGSITVAQLVKVIENKLKKTVPRIAVPTWAARAILRGSILASPVPMIDRYRRTLDTWLANAVYSGVAFEERYGSFPETTVEEAIGREVEFYLQDK